MPEIGNRAPVLYGLFLVGQDKLPFGKLAVRHGLQLVHRCGGKLAHMPLKVGGVVDIKPFPNVAQRHILCKRCSIDEFIIYPVNGKSSRLQTVIRLKAQVPCFVPAL